MGCIESKLSSAEDYIKELEDFKYDAMLLIKDYSYWEDTHPPFKGKVSDGAKEFLKVWEEDI